MILVDCEAAIEATLLVDDHGWVRSVWTACTKSGVRRPVLAIGIVNAIDAVRVTVQAIRVENGIARVFGTTEAPQVGVMAWPTEHHHLVGHRGRRGGRRCQSPRDCLPGCGSARRANNS